MKSERMTVGQAIVKFLDQQYVLVDDIEIKFVEGIFTIFGHGNVLGLGDALYENKGSLKVFQGRNEQGMAHVAAAFAKQNNRHKIIACTSSVGPGAANMVTAAACATVNKIPLLLLPGDIFATRQPNPVLQQLEIDSSLTISTNDAFRPVCKYFDRIERPEQAMTALINAMRVLTSPSKTGAVCVALPQDVQGESYDFPIEFFKKRVHVIRRQEPYKYDVDEAIKLIKESKKPLIICGGGVRYSQAGEELEKLAIRYNIPYVETQAGKSATKSSNPLNLGGIGVTGNLSANKAAQEADLVIGVGTRFSDFTTQSKLGFRDAKVIAINVSDFDSIKLEALPVIGDAKETLKIIYNSLNNKYTTQWENRPKELKELWNSIYNELSLYRYNEDFEPIVKARRDGSIEEFAKLTGSNLTQVSAISLIRDLIEDDAIICGASGSLPGCLQRMWTTDKIDSYHMEYGYSCMGYEVAAGLGCKLASPNQEVYVMLGDGSFQMLHSELATSIMENKKVNIMLFDNCGFGCINNLQMSNGIGSLATEFRYRDENGNLEGDLVPVDYSLIAKGYGAISYTIRNLKELEDAIIDSKKQTKSCLFDIKVLPKTMTGGYESWWHVGVASTSKYESIIEACKDKDENLNKARKY